MSNQQEVPPTQPFNGSQDVTKIPTFNSSSSFPLQDLSSEGLSDEDKIIKKRALRKLDIRTVPPLLVLWLLAFLDRSSVGNAKIAGLDKDLGLKGLEFSTGLAIFYVFYIAIELPSNLLLKKIGPNIFLPGIVVAWGIVTLCTAFLENYAGFVAVRAILGLAEGGLLPAMVLYLSMLYPRHELQFRIACFFASAGLSGSFGGLLAYGLTQITSGSGLLSRPWTMIFLIEGALTIVLAIIVGFFLPAGIAKSKFLTEDEKRVSLFVMGTDLSSTAASKPSNQVESKSGSSSDQEKKGEESAEPKEKLEQKAIATSQTLDKEVFEWYEVKRGLKSVMAWNTGVAYLCVLNSLYSFTLFLPTILEPLFKTSDQARIQLLTVPPFVPATVATIVVAILADRYKVRGPFILGLLPTSMAGYIILIASRNNEARYAAVFLIAFGVYATVPCILSILPNNVSGHGKRATVVALNLMIANCAGFVASFIYTSKFGPDFVLSHSVMLGSLVLAWILIALHVCYCTWENKARREGRRDHNVEEYEQLVREGKTKAPIGDRSPLFVLTV